MVAIQLMNNKGTITKITAYDIYFAILFLNSELKMITKEIHNNSVPVEMNINDNLLNG